MRRKRSIFGLGTLHRLHENVGDRSPNGHAGNHLIRVRASSRRVHLTSFKFHRAAVGLGVGTSALIGFAIRSPEVWAQTASWHQDSVPSGVILNDISCVNASDCWAVGSSPAPIIATTDGGRTWSSQVAPGNIAALNSISCVSTSDCWAIGYTILSENGGNEVIANKVIATTDGGADWSVETIPVMMSMSVGISCTDARHCWIFGSTPGGVTLIATTDGGADWSAQILPSTVDGLVGISCVNASDCWAVGTGLVSTRLGTEVVATTDGGSTWTTQTLPDGLEVLQSISCVNASDCWETGIGTGGVADLIITRNGGNTWSVQSVPGIMTYISKISCADSNDCWAVGDGFGSTGAIIATTDGGSTWTTQTLPNGVGHLTSISCVSDGYCWSVGQITQGSGRILISNNAPVPPDLCSSYSGNDAFVCSAYEYLLNRAPDPGGLQFWSSQLSAGASLETVAYGIVTSDEYRDDLVSSYYETFLGRAPEPGGLAYWVAQLGEGGTDQSVLAGILGSYEFDPDSYLMQGQGYVSDLYANLLQRGPDPGGLAFWVGQLSSGVSQSSVAAGFLSSTEYQSDFVQAQYLYFLGRSADQAGLAYWVGQLASGASQESVVAGFVGSAELYAEATS